MPVHLLLDSMLLLRDVQLPSHHFTNLNVKINIQAYQICDAKRVKKSGLWHQQVQLPVSMLFFTGPIICFPEHWFSYLKEDGDNTLLASFCLI